MSVFFTTPPVAAGAFGAASLVPSFAKALESALAADPQTIANPAQSAVQIAANVADQVARSATENVLPSKQFRWGRAIFSVVFLLIIFFAGIYCAHDDKLLDYSKVLLHSFELLLGALVGTIIGEGSTA